MFFRRLKERFLKRTARFFKKPRKGGRERCEKPLEERSQKKAGRNGEGFRYENSGTWQGRETLRWQWIRAYEYDREVRFEQRYEWQGKVAEKIIRGVGYNKIINC